MNLSSQYPFGLEEFLTVFLSEPDHPLCGTLPADESLAIEIPHHPAVDLDLSDGPGQGRFHENAAGRYNQVTR
jgi:hypothetical protein